VGDGIAVDTAGNAYVTGVTSSTTFPTQGAIQPTFGGGGTDAFVSKLNPTGTSPLVYSTFLGGGGADAGAGIAVDSSGNAYVTGQTNSTSPTPFPTTANATQAANAGGFDAFVSEINPAGSSLSFSTYLGGALVEDSGGDYGAIAVDSGGGNIYVTGTTASTDFPATTGAFETVTGGGTDAFVVKYSQPTTSAQTFTLAATALTPTAVNPGGTATSTVSVTSTNGFAGSVTLSCAVSPAKTLGPTCGAASATPTTPATLTVNTSPATALLHHSPSNHSSGMFYAMLLPIAGISLAGISFSSIRSRNKKLFGILMIGMVMASLLLMPACGGSSSGGGGGGGGSAGTPAGTYTITVTGTATGATETGTSPALTLTVN
jgi:hypothetical protein